MEPELLVMRDLLQVLHERQLGPFRVQAGLGSV